jgi:hypothetical protein
MAICIPENLHDWPLHEDQCNDAVLWSWREEVLADVWVDILTGVWQWSLENAGGDELGFGTTTNAQDAVDSVIALHERELARGRRVC